MENKITFSKTTIENNKLVICTFNISDGDKIIFNECLLDNLEIVFYKEKFIDKLKRYFRIIKSKI